ncbi:hypothetical protein D0T66_00605 [Dysgonomonas sp. 25]|nr:hypothetical protein [Dysgonomonas sp. 25]
MKRRAKKIVRYSLYAIAFGVLSVAFMLFFSNSQINKTTESYIYDNADSIPPQKVGLVLGTARYLRRGTPNGYFTYRIQAAKELYDAGKVKAFIVSGDNGHASYNEPRDMYNALVEKGIPDSIIHFDYAGFRTLDSVVRMKKVFGQDSIIIISQEFHNQRAIYIAQHHGITAYGYNAKDISLNRKSLKTKIRERFARVKVFVDIVTGKQPKFLGEPIEIKTD